MIVLFKSIFYIDCYLSIIDYFVFDEIYTHNRHFLPSGRADLTACTSLQGIRGEIPQLHTLCLLSAATSTHE
jgi:hypothetical protein